eukprot:2514883-Rhodomonas_salina.2
MVMRVHGAQASCWLARRLRLRCTLSQSSLLPRLAGGQPARAQAERALIVLRAATTPLPGARHAVALVEALRSPSLLVPG